MAANWSVEIVWLQGSVEILLTASATFDWIIKVWLYAFVFSRRIVFVVENVEMEKVPYRLEILIKFLTVERSVFVALLKLNCLDMANSVNDFEYMEEGVNPI